ncbi:hypothetical protein DSOL_5052 [Desulfosporosinus metallidurans]|uniref:Uncharacterized protein n=1 Tax=Desulfosporosinus metallidurans TaxID=1888891 RepID=A0A1Q8QG78_9FIRM|nr:hypothetical protein DSOL_5052 [Desulfosporosinus metallidurans]
MTTVHLYNKNMGDNSVSHVIELLIYVVNAIYAQFILQFWNLQNTPQ